MFLDGSTLYVVNASNGQLLKIPFVAGAPSGASSVADATTDWRGRAVFLASVLPNTAPTAAFSVDCDGTVCDFDASSSGDADGTVQSFEWSFSDGEGAGGVAPRHDFLASGTYTATLTVTDDGGLSSSVTQQVVVTKPNVAPTASFTVGCDYLVCTFDASGSDDEDGTVETYAWDFGDGTTDSGTTAQHAFAGPGSYAVTLTVTDDAQATDTATSTQVVVAAPSASTVSYVGGAASQGNASTLSVTTPTTVSAGDRLLMALTLNVANRVVSDPTGVTGWTPLSTTASGSMQTRLYTKVAAAGDGGRRIGVTLDAATKYTMTVAAYSGVRNQPLAATTLAETVTRSAHTTPGVSAPAGSWIVSYWADKSSATTGFTLPNSSTGRQALCGTGSGHICSVLADSGSAVPTGDHGGETATADSANATATMSSIVLRTVEQNQAPTASFTTACDGAVCDFDASASGDADGSVTAYSWDFGDGQTASGRTVRHDFVSSGTRDVTLTVTDDEGTTGSLVTAVNVVRTNALPTATFTVSCDYLACTFDGSASSDPDGSLVSYRWDFGDGATDTTSGAVVTHTFDTGGAYDVALRVEDNDGGRADSTRSARPAAPVAITHVDSTVNQGNVATPNTTVPASVRSGDRLVLALSLNSATVATGTPSGVTGWTLLDRATSGSMQTVLLTKVATSDDAGRTVRFAMDAAAKYTLTLAAYRGDMLDPQVADQAETVTRVGHTTPTLTAGAGDVALSYWADKSSATTGFTLPAGVTLRQAACGTNSGRVCSVLADSGGPVGAGPYGGLTATSDAASGSATMWTVLLRQDG
ncbi:PKD domain-containing protein [Nocardioides anomalus]|nr:PKD domain-containing protein [Nocardioides anomalus]